MLGFATMLLLFNARDNVVIAADENCNVNVSVSRITIERGEEGEEEWRELSITRRNKHQS